MSGQSFSVINRPNIELIIQENFSSFYEIIKQAYLLHARNKTINPNSYFLRFPDDAPNARIIALPAAIREQSPVAGLKWIASYPDNIQQGIQRASATIILNDFKTGYPFALLEGAFISAVRTVLSASLALQYLKPNKKIKALSIIGCGHIAKHFISSLIKLGWQLDKVLLHDLSSEHSLLLQKYIESNFNINVEVVSDLESSICNSSVLVTTTTVAEPYIKNPLWFEHNPTILNLSLRDFAPDILLSSNNIVDDIEHVLSASTSPHLAYLKSGNQDFICGTIDGLIQGDILLDKNKPTIFSPMGMGILDLAVANHVYQLASESDKKLDITNFFGDITR